MIQRAIREVMLGVAAMGAIALLSVSSYAETVQIGGTGMGLGAMQRIGESLAAEDPKFQFEVLPSLGTSGGIKALAAEVIDVAIAGRAMKAKEKALGVREAACITTALIFATTHKKPGNLVSARLPALYANPSPRWQDGKPLKIILRARSGSENPYLAATVPGMAEALKKAYERRGMPVGSTDQENADLATRTQGSLAVMTLLQLRGERLNLNVLPLDGVVASETTLANKTYPMPLRVCLLLRTNPTANAARLVAHLSSATGRSLLQSFAAIPAK
ncbi:MAG: hypothetical protein O3C34_14475 [Proteobacteria bacterium]|nr:hypothetical protein [Pseudomonadota bacterium]